MSALSAALAAMAELNAMGKDIRGIDAHLKEFSLKATMDQSGRRALAWIKEALPWLEKHRENLLLLSEINSEINKGGVNVFTEPLAALDALIARAKPEESNHAEN